MPTKTKPKETRAFNPAESASEREDQLILLATNLAEQQLRDGTASPLVIAHYLRAGSTKEKYEREKLKEEVKLASAKTKAIQDAEKIEKLYSDAIKAMRRYSGGGSDEPDEDDDSEIQ